MMSSQLKKMDKRQGKLKDPFKNSNKMLINKPVPKLNLEC